MFILSHSHITFKGNDRILKKGNWKNIVKKHPIMLMSVFNYVRKIIAFLHIILMVFYYRYVESKPLFHMFGEQPDPALHAKLMANCEESQEITVRKS
jgi:hypothetical protein